MASSNVTAWKPGATDPSRQPETSKLKHLIESQQFTLPLLMELFQRTRGMERVVARGGTLEYQNKILANLFYQPSTRTRFCLNLRCTGWEAKSFPQSRPRHFRPKSQESKSKIRSALSPTTPM